MAVYNLPILHQSYANVTVIKLSRHVAKDCRHPGSSSFPPFQLGNPNGLASAAKA
ncbi:hypothetical protein [Methylotuvimicrobium sp. KM1]|uniref:hypothetical protein n=1 Tax=Methylotuvimicrobium sp. KM1 TaxID=3377707 RepID=UPI00384B5E5F